MSHTIIDLQAVRHIPLSISRQSVTYHFRSPGSRSHTIFDLQAVRRIPLSISRPSVTYHYRFPGSPSHNIIDLQAVGHITLSTSRQSSLRPLPLTAGSVALAAIPFCVSRGPRVLVQRLVNFMLDLNSPQQSRR